MEVRLRKPILQQGSNLHACRDRSYLFQRETHCKRAMMAC